MNVFFETMRRLSLVEGRVYFIQGQARLDDVPVFLPDPELDGRMVQVKTVLHDGGILRMWYLCDPDFARQGPKRGRYRTAYAESDDGLAWRRPALGLVSDGPAGNNYVNLNVGGVFVDPTAPPAARYRATVYAPQLLGAGDDPRGLSGGFFTAHSADGLRWELDARQARWLSGDTITSAWHPGWNRGIAAMKFVRLSGGLHRRAIWTAELSGGRWGEAACALAPDEFDDVIARARGFNSTDYYKMGLLPAGAGLVGLIENFRHWLPLSQTPPQHYAIYGMSDITLAYQDGPRDRWLHAPGRAAFIGGDRPAWAAGWLGVASAPVAAGAEHWMYVTADQYSHAWDRTPDWQVDPDLQRRREDSGEQRVIGLARWPRWRMFGFKAAPAGVVELELGALDRPCELILNCETGRQGCVRVQLFARAGRGDKIEISGRSGLDDAIPLHGDCPAAKVAWRDGTRIVPVPHHRLVARIVLEDAAIYAWDLVSF